MTREVEIRLVGPRGGAGRLLAADVLVLVEAVKDLVYRLTRAVAEGPGLGRTTQALERLSAVRVAIDADARLVFTVGDVAALELDDPVTVAAAEALGRVVDGMAANQRPPDISDAAAQAVERLVKGLVRAAPGAEVALAGGGVVRLDSRHLQPGPWRRPERVGDLTAVGGVLEMVDLHTARFRLRDVTGSAVDLVEVRNAGAAAPLVGRQVRATGVLAPGHETGHSRMEDAVVEAGSGPEPSPGSAQSGWDAAWGQGVLPEDGP